MKLTRKNKKGFTIIELVIVIAVIGVLTAVLVPTFINLVGRANEASDQSLVKNLNTALKMEEDARGSKPETMQDAVDDLKKEGYLLENLISKSGQDLLWKKSANEFVLNQENEYSGNDYWKIVKELPTFSNQKYSYYAGLNFDNASTANNLKYGFDAGESAVTETLHYVGTGEGNTVYIRTNGGTLNIEAPLDTVRHYGEGMVLNITAIAGDSYHEHGYFPKALIAQGRIVVEDSGEIPAFEITAIPSEEYPISIETKNDLVVSASPEVVEALGDDKLDYVDVKVASTDVNVVVDEKIETSNVEIGGQTATEDDLVSITKVSNLGELQAALSAAKPYVMLTADITANSFTNIIHSVTIDGDGHSMSGTGGVRTGQTYDVLCVNWQQTNNPIDVCIKNLSLTNTKTSGIGRAFETRAAGLKSLEISNCKFESKAVNNDGNAFCIGGSSSTALALNVTNSQFISTTTGYAWLIWVPIDGELTDTYLEGYSGLYFKNGSSNSNLKLSNSTLSAPNVHSGKSDNFAAIVFETEDIHIELVDSVVNVTGSGQAIQTGVLFSYDWAKKYGTQVINAVVTFKGNCQINGKISSGTGIEPTNRVVIEGGTYTFDPSEYVAEGHTVKADGSLYTVL